MGAAAIFVVDEKPLLLSARNEIQFIVEIKQSARAGDALEILFWWNSGWKREQVLPRSDISNIKFLSRVVNVYHF